MKTLHLIESGGFYGSERMLLDLATAQARAGDSPEILSVGPNDCADKPIERIARERGLPMTSWRMRPGLNVLGMRRIINWAKRRGVDVFHSHSYRFDALLAFADPFKRCASVSTMHGVTQTREGKIRFAPRLGLLCQRRIDTTIFVSQQLQRDYGGYAKQSVVIPNGIEIKPIQAIRKRVTPKANPEVQLLAIGRLSHEKNYPLLLNTMRVLADNEFPCRLTHMGDGALRDELVAHSKQLGLTNIEFAGYASDVLSILSESDALVFTSRTEGMPISIIEAQLMGVPIASTAVGGIPEMLQGYPLGRTTTTHTPDAMAALIQDVCQAGTRRRTEPQDVAAMEDRFSSDRLARDYRSVYEQVLE